MGIACMYTTKSGAKRMLVSHFSTGKQRSTLMLLFLLYTCMFFHEPLLDFKVLSHFHLNDFMSLVCFIGSKAKVTSHDKPLSKKESCETS
jgi:hypothetical protein